MKTTILSAIFILLIGNVTSDRFLVEVYQGWLEGERVELATEDGYYYSFKGIPYAAPPIGRLRFKSPRRPLRWHGIRKAIKHGSVCPQVNLTTKQYTPGNEDCLFINVYSPDLTPCTLLPVLFYIHGGGYQSGSGNDDLYGPDYIVRKNMVVVTFNYRLNVLGFLCLGTKDVPGNAGMKDQVAALKWVRANIKQFGGDPNKVTIMGQSAGGAAVGLHITSPMSKGLFKRAIAMSGSPYCDWSVGFQPERRASVLGKLLGSETQDPNELLTFLQNVSPDKLLNMSPFITTYEEMTNNMFFYVPVLERYDGVDSFITKNTYRQIDSINKVDILFGHTDQETLFRIELIVDTLLKQYNRYPENFVPTKITNKHSPGKVLAVSDNIINYYFGNKTVDINSLKEFVRYGNYATFIYDTIRYFATLPRLGNTKKYMYQFSSYSNRNVNGMQGAKYGIIGASHMDDTLYLFDPKSLNMTLDKNSREFQLIEQFTTLVTNFAIYGNPTPNTCFNVTWPEFRPTTKKYVDIGDYLNIFSLNDDEDLDFWRDYVYGIVH